MASLPARSAPPSSFPRPPWRITRANAKLKTAAELFVLPSPDTRAERLRSVLHVVYLLFNEGYASSPGPDLARTDLPGEAIRLTRHVHAQRPDDPEVAGLLALMLLTDARRPARTRADGDLVPLADQDAPFGTATSSERAWH